MACRSGTMALRVALAAALVALAAPAATPAPPADTFEAAFQGRCGAGSPCEQLCWELHDGTFECGCGPGFLLKVDGYGCTQLNATNADPTADAAEDVLYSKDVSFSAELEIAPSSKLSTNNINTRHIEKTTTKPESNHISNVLSSAERTKELDGLASLMEDGISKLDINMISEDALDEVKGRVTTQGPSLEQKVPGATNPPPWTAAVERCDCSSCDDRCPCPLDCKHGQTVSTPRFSGTSWLALRALRGAYKRVRIRIRVRPERARGVLLLTGEHDDLSGDYLALILRQGHVELRFDCGSGSGVLRSPEPVRLGRWNTISVYRHRWDAWLRLNNGKRVRGRSKGLFSRMTFREPVWVGGGGNTTGLQAKLGLSEGLLGCVDYLRINGDTYGLVRDAVATSEIAECAPTLAPWKPRNEATTSETTPEHSHNDLHAIYDINDIVHFEDNDIVMRDAAPKKEDERNELDNSIEQFKSAIKISNYVPKIVDSKKILEKSNKIIHQAIDLNNISKKGVELTPMQAGKCECQHGGGCVGGVCLCPLGYAGSRCEITLDLKVPRFNGSSYLRLPGLGNSAQSWLNIQITLKPSSGDGLVLYDSERDDGDGDFFSLHLRRYYVEFAFDLGSGIALVRSAYPLKQNKWHRVIVNRSGRRATLTVKNIDAVAPGDNITRSRTRSVKSRGTARRLTLRRALLLGGAPAPLPPRLALPASLSGCVSQLTINDEEISVVAAALGGVNVDNCEEPRDDTCTDVNLCKEPIPPLPMYPDNLTETEAHHSIVPKKGFFPKHRKYKPKKHLSKDKKKTKFIKTNEVEIYDHTKINEVKINDFQNDEGTDDMTEGPVYDGRTYMQVKYLDNNEINWGDTNTYPSFSGKDSFIHIDDEETMKRLLSYTLDINIRFRCSAPRGLLVWSGSSTANDEEADFLSLGIEDSALVFRYNLGSGEVVIVANHTKVDDGLWHRARATRNRQAGVLEVDGLGSVGKISPGKLKQLNTDNGLYIGGLPSIEINSMGKYKTGLIGCVSQISLSGDFDIPLSLSKLPHTITNNVGRCAP